MFNVVLTVSACAIILAPSLSIVAPVEITLRENHFFSNESLVSCLGAQSV